MKRLRSALLWSLVLSAALPASGAASAPPDEERARRALSEMVAAYKSLRSFEQETTYDNAGQSGPDGMARLHVLMRRPNRLLLQVWRGSADAGKSVETRFVCDGKFTWTWLQDPGYYTQQKAPKGPSGFRDRIVSIDLAMLFGFDPFGELLTRTRGIRLEEPTNVDGVDADVVLLDIGSAEATGDIRLSIGQKDHLLRRFAYETKATVAAPQPDPTAAGPAVPPAPKRFGYTNHVVVNPDLPDAMFRWVPPAGAFRYTPYPSLGGTGDLRTIPGAQDPNIPTGKQKLIPLQEYIKRSKKVGKGR